MVRRERQDNPGARREAEVAARSACDRAVLLRGPHPVGTRRPGRGYGTQGPEERAVVPPSPPQRVSFSHKRTAAEDHVKHGYLFLLQL